LGSIFGDSVKYSDGSTPSSNTNTSELADKDAKIKIAFAEGVIHGSSVKPNARRSLLSIFFLLLFVIFFFRSYVTFGTGTGGAVGGGTSGGINLRALTGNIDYEVNPQNVNVKFSDVKGLKDAKQVTFLFSLKNKTRSLLNLFKFIC
jgi:ATP-dependent Zn protease